MKPDSRLIAFSLKVYRWLLILYPADFREAFGREMTLAFRDYCRLVERRGGKVALGYFWLTVLIDLAATALVERVRDQARVPGRMVVGLCGLIGTLGGISLLTVVYIITVGGGFVRMPLWPTFHWYYPLSYALPLAIGTAGLYWASGPETRLRAGLASAFVGAAAMALDVLAFDGWLGQGPGMAIHAAGLLLFGVAGYRTGAFPGWLAVPMVTGAFFPTIALGFLLTQAKSLPMVFLFYGTGWMLLGITVALAELRPSWRVSL
ncbi:MAG TPA: hypothetical protein VF177_18705 [Anaerolineae bacterium]